MDILLIISSSSKSCLLLIMKRIMMFGGLLDTQEGCLICVCGESEKNKVSLQIRNLHITLNKL